MAEKPFQVSITAQVTAYLAGMKAASERTERDDG